MQKYKKIYKDIVVHKNFVSLQRLNFNSGTIPQARKVCRFCICIYELRYNNIPH